MIKKLVAHPDIPRDIRLNLGHWCTIRVLSFLADLEIIPIEVVRGLWGMGAGGQWAEFCSC
jgi:hypothetical protein